MTSTVNSTGTSTGVVITPDSSGSLALQTAGTTAVTIDTSQNVGVGTATPAVTLDTRSASAATARLSRSGTSGQLVSLVFEDGSGTLGTANTTRIASSTGYMAFSTGGTSGDTAGGTERMRITSGGWVKAQGDSTYQDTAGLYHEFSSAQNNQAFIVACSNTGSSVVGIRSKLPSGASASAKFFLSELAGTGTVFQVISNGNVQNSNNSYGAISDAKLKENIVDATPKLAGLMQVKVRNYNLKSDPTHKQLGVVAQELEQVFPSMIEETTDTDDKGNDLGTTTKAVKYSVFVPMLIKAMQEQQALITAQAETINALTARVVALESKVGV